MSNARITKAQIIAILADSIESDNLEEFQTWLQGQTVKELKAYAKEQGVDLVQESVQEDPEPQVTEGEGEIQVETSVENMDRLVEKFHKMLDKGPTETNYFYSAAYNAIMEEAGFNGIEWTPLHSQLVQVFWREIQKFSPKTRSEESVVKAAATILEKDDSARRDSGGDHGYRSPNAKADAPEYIQRRIEATLAEVEAAKAAEEAEAESEDEAEEELQEA